ncbi:MAG: response regulator [Planctomycetaceae bacterium]|nr:response regulator [Planctomycetaceae bacterium]
MRPPRTKKLLLVVDDSPTGRRIVSEALRAHGYDVITAEDGEQALDLAFRRKPNLIVLDIVLPKQNGFQVCRRLKAEPHTRQVKVVLLSSKILATDKQWGMKQGADGYVTKPFVLPELLAVIDQLLIEDQKAPESDSEQLVATGITEPENTET